MNHFEASELNLTRSLRGDTLLLLVVVRYVEKHWKRLSKLGQTEFHLKISTTHIYQPIYKCNLQNSVKSTEMRWEKCARESWTRTVHE